MTSIYCAPITPPTVYYIIFSDNTLKTCTLYVPIGSKSAYEANAPWKNFVNIKEYDFSGIEDALVDEASVSVENGEIVVKGATTVEVYSIDSRLVYNGNSESITIPNKGIYIVVANGKSFKVAI